MSNYIDNIVKNAVTYDLVSKPLADDMANEFSIQSTYAVGDYVMHDYKLYKCISAVTTAGNWNSAKWQECKIGDEINGGVKFTAQTLTSEQKAQARNNIGAVSQEEATPDAIRYSAQSLTDAQKNQARVNVGTVASTSIAEEFSTSKAYAVGDMVMYNSKLYKFKTAHSAGAWNNAQVDAISVDDELSNIKGDLGDLTDLETVDKTNIVSAINEAAQSGLSDDAKSALLNCFAHVYWNDGDGQKYYDALESMLYPSRPPFTMEIINRESIGLVTTQTCSANANLTARCRFGVPVKNNNYTIKSADTTKYQVNVYNLINDTLTEITVDGVTYNVYTCSDSETPIWGDSKTVTGNYFWCAFKKLDGTDFTNDEINNAFGTVYTVEQGVI